MNLLLIDEDSASMRYYLLEFREAKFLCKHCRNVDDALVELKERGSTYDLVLLDSAMPPGEAYAKVETEAGTQTGKFLFEDIRKLLPDVPVIILTNFSSLEWIQNACKGPHVAVVRKLEMLPIELIDKVQKMINVSTKQS
jgi:DNA-binding NtrC family response regulator